MCGPNDSYSGEPFSYRRYAEDKVERERGIEPEPARPRLPLMADAYPDKVGTYQMMGPKAGAELDRDVMHDLRYLRDALLELRDTFEDARRCIRQEMEQLRYRQSVVLPPQGYPEPSPPLFVPNSITIPRQELVEFLRSIRLALTNSATTVEEKTIEISSLLASVRRRFL